VRLRVRRAGGLAGAEIRGIGLSITECLKEISDGGRGPSLRALREEVDKAISPNGLSGEARLAG
jgi:DNA polymerase/3'-5' exonuclease PolX